jgi:hypothetical protein
MYGTTEVRLFLMLHIYGAELDLHVFDQSLSNFRYNPRPSFRPLRLRGV